MADFKAKMYQIQFRLGLCPRPRWGTYAPPNPLVTLRGPTSKGRGRDDTPTLRATLSHISGYAPDLKSQAAEFDIRDGKEPSFIGFGSVRVLANFFKWRVLVLFGFYDYHSSVRVRVLLGNVTFI